MQYHVAPFFIAGNSKSEINKWISPDLHTPAYVIMMIEDILVPNRHQTIYIITVQSYDVHT